jgi:hypothetical protein
MPGDRWMLRRSARGVKVWKVDSAGRKQIARQIFGRVKNVLQSSHRASLHISPSITLTGALLTLGATILKILTDRF